MYHLILNNCIINDYIYRLMLENANEDTLPVLLRDLYRILTTKPILDTISIVEIPEPLIFECGHLGLSKSAFKKLGLYAHSRFNAVSIEEQKHDKHNELDKLSTVLILLNPDDYRYWNHRKRQRSDCTIDTTDLSRELWLSSHPLKLKPKSAEPFNHCRWLMTRHRDLVTDSTVLGQLKMCQEAASLYKHNYYAWNYRQWLLLNFSHLLDLEAELGLSKRWVETHISEFSGMNYRFSVLVLSFRARGSHSTDSSEDHLPGVSRKGITRKVVAEIWFVCELIVFYPDHEALWNYLRMLFLFCEAHKLEYIRKCKDQLASIEKIKNRFARRFRENLIIANLFGIPI